MSSSNKGDVAGFAFPEELGNAKAAHARLVYPTIKEPNLTALVLSRHVKLCKDQPVRGVIRFLSDTVVKKESAYGFSACGRKAGAVITEFSHQSRYNMLHTLKNCGVVMRSMMTITYPKEFSSDGRKVKKDLKRLLNWIRRNIPGTRGLWFLEFQMRGAPHFHILLDVDMESYGDLVTIRRRSAYRKSSSYRTCKIM
ncbi:MAG: hypothetical protein ABI443_04130, partial [Chthoniobacterales bacterium]